jgi:hypothetical protein
VTAAEIEALTIPVTAAGNIESNCVRGASQVDDTPCIDIDQEEEPVEYGIIGLR